jgi:YegS/Rv2252/BmrU family lipid kinase
MPPSSTFVIVNPASGSGKTGLRWSGWEAHFRADGSEFEVGFTTEPGHATRLAREAAQLGYKKIISVGGDGTLNEMLNGLIENDRAVADVELGVLPVGTGSDFARALGIPKDPRKAWQHLMNGAATPLDVGRIDTLRGDQTITRYFANVAGLGFDGEVSDRVNRSGRKGGGTIPYLTTMFASLMSYKNKTVKVTIDDRTIEGRMNSVVVCNARYFGGGMHIAPHAEWDDGQFDVIILGDLSKLEVLANTPRLYQGTHLLHRKVKFLRGRSIRVEAKELMYLQAEGELIGEAPTTFTMLPHLMKVLM